MKHHWLSLACPTHDYDVRDAGQPQTLIAMNYTVFRLTQAYCYADGLTLVQIWLGSEGPCSSPTAASRDPAHITPPPDWSMDGEYTDLMRTVISLPHRGTHMLILPSNQCLTTDMALLHAYEWPLAMHSNHCRSPLCPPAATQAPRGCV